MASIKFNDIYSRFYLKAEAYDLLNIKEDNITEFLTGWLHSAASKPNIRRLFSSLKLDDEIQVMTYEMSYKIDDDYDTDFVMDILGIGMVLEWIQPKIYSLTNIIQMFGSNEQKFYSQSGHLKTLQDVKKALKKEQGALIRDRGYIWNSYLDGEK